MTSSASEGASVNPGIAEPRILVYGYGNPGRADDGLGPATAEAILRLDIPGVVTDSNYQLNAEDALAISDKEIVVFVDATESDIPDVRLSRLEPSAEVSFTTHAMSPGSVLALCGQLYDRHPAAFVLEIKGHEWEVREGLSDRGAKNLTRAVEIMADLLRAGSREAFEKAIGCGMRNADFGLGISE